MNAITSIPSSIAQHGDRYIINWIMIFALLCVVAGGVWLFRWLIGRLQEQTKLLADLCAENMKGRLEIAEIVSDGAAASREFKEHLRENTEFLRRNNDSLNRILAKIPALMPTLIAAALLSTGCAGLGDNGDPLASRAKKTEASTRVAFAQIEENANPANPEIRAFAAWLSEPIPPANHPRGETILSELYVVAQEYETNRDTNRLRGYVAFSDRQRARANALLANVK